LIGTAGTAFGIMTCGWVVRYLKGLDGWDEIRAYRIIFFAYAVLGLIKLLLSLALSSKIELEKPTPAPVDAERAPLLRENAQEDAQDPDLKKNKKRSLRSLLPDISAESRLIITSLCLLFALDAMASGFVPLSWTTWFFKTKFNIEQGELGSIFFTTSIIAAASMLVASSLAKRFGNVKTMVFTHLPSAIALALIPFPNELHWALTFLILRSCTQSMDVAPRSAFLAAVILPNERTAVNGLLNIVKTSASSIGPAVTGVLAQHNMMWISFLAAGCLKATYDLGMLAVFAEHVSHEDKAKRAAEQEAAENGAQA
jgi:MFS family permease